MKFLVKCSSVFIVGIWFIVTFTHSAYQQQGFTSYSEGTETIDFVCEKQCFLLLGVLASNEVITFKGSFEGGGQIGYGLLVGEQIYPGEIVESTNDMDQMFVIKNHQLYNQAPKDQTQIVLVINGVLKTTGMILDYGKLHFGEKLGVFLGDFWRNEPLRPYSINLRYGVRILGVSLVKVLYRVFAIGLIVITFLIQKKNKRQEIIMYFVIILILLMTMRNLWNWTDWTMTGYRTYVTPPLEERTFFDLGDYPVFIQKMRNTLSLDDKFGKENCTMYFDAAQEWPFKAHADVVYMKPCDPSKEKNDADYIVYYKKPIDSDKLGKEVLLEWNNSFLINNK